MYTLSLINKQGASDITKQVSKKSIMNEIKKWNQKKKLICRIWDKNGYLLFNDKATKVFHNFKIKKEKK